MASITDTETAAPRTIWSPTRILSLVSPAVWTLLVIVIFWEIAVRVMNVPVYILPSPTRIAQVFASYWPRLLINSGYTMIEVLSGFLLSIVIGVPLAVLVTYSRFAERAVYPLIVATQSIPKVAVAPLLLAWFGYGMTPKVVIVMLLSFFPIVINSVVGMKSASAEMIYLAQSMGASPWQAFWKFRLPQALPNIFAGLKLATVLSVIGAMVGEFIGADRGLGYIILVAGSSFDIARQFAAIIMISAIGMIFFAVIERIERVALPWRAPRNLPGEA
ncbi:ABC transporter permease [Rhizobium sp. 18055]|uniref:ABC transporter permease n=1 Tax=Rhizobium sp. 18055 TaxID=2681403 RepID=UPI001357CCCA|nr:ABC transporter permease [Rhizobium sp. 18055]